MSDAAAAEAFRRLVHACLAGVPMGPAFGSPRGTWSALDADERRSRDRERKQKARADARAVASHQTL